MSRKLVIACLCQAGFTVLLWFGKIPPQTYSDLTFVTLGGYFAGNVGEHFAKRPKV